MFYLFESKDFRIDEKCILFHLKSSFRSQDIQVIVMLEKRLDQKDKINSKIHGVTTWLRNNCNTYIAQDHL